MRGMYHTHMWYNMKALQQIASSEYYVCGTYYPYRCENYWACMIHSNLLPREFERAVCD